jgi:hypothetical protein
MGFMATGCQGMLKKHSEAPNVLAMEKPETEIPTETVEDPLTQTEMAVSQHLDRAEDYLNRGDVKRAMEEIYLVIPHCGTCRKELADRALTVLAAGLATMEQDKSSDSFCSDCFKTLQTSHPDAIFGPASSCWLAALHEIAVSRDDRHKLKSVIRAQRKKIKTLEQQLELLKAVDLELETDDAGESFHE